MKIAICNIPLRSEDKKTSYPPLGAMVVTQALKRSGYDALFYDINFFRPSDTGIQNYFLEHKPDVIGVSATVSTSYVYLKKLTFLIKKVLPKAIIIVGGAITASSDIVLKFTNTDVCVVGEGEITIVNLMRYFEKFYFYKDKMELKNIKGICFLDDRGEMVFTGYEMQVPIHELWDPDYEIIEQYSKIDGYIISPSYYEQFDYDQRSHQPRFKNKKLATVVTSRGCIARCTFCHRWQKGIRIIPVDRVINHITFLMEKYDVRFISFGDEDFGASEKWVDEFLEKISALDILYRISATRVDHVSIPLLKRFRETGCVAVHHGFESGSNKMLKVMEKRTTVEMNIQAALGIHEAGMQTVPAIVVGMPGETYETIEESAAFLRKITEFYPYEPHVSPNLLVALPGTPVYEYARMKGFLGSSLEDEERYLMRVSDHGGESPLQFNFTDYPYFIVQAWARNLIFSTVYHWHKKNGLPTISTLEFLVNIGKYLFLGKKSKNFSKVLFKYPLFYHFRHFILTVYIMLENFREVGTKLFLQRCMELVVWPFKRKYFVQYVSLREFINARIADLHSIKNQPTNPILLKLGR